MPSRIAPPSRPRTATLGTCVAALLVCGCGGAAPKAHSVGRRHQASPAGAVCIPATREALARFLEVSPARIKLAASVASNAMPQCALVAPAATSGRVVTVTVNVDNSPQPYFRLERTAVEAEQVFTPTRLVPAPVNITGVGLDAYWFPAQSQFMTTDGSRLITVSVTSPPIPQRREVPLAEELSRVYLRHYSTARASANGYPSG
jgi:hypothetical protein